MCIRRTARNRVASGSMHRGFATGSALTRAANEPRLEPFRVYRTHRPPSDDRGGRPARESLLSPGHYSVIPHLGNLSRDRVAHGRLSDRNRAVGIFPWSFRGRTVNGWSLGQLGRGERRALWRFDEQRRDLAARPRRCFLLRRARGAKRDAGAITSAVTPCGAQCNCASSWCDSATVTPVATCTRSTKVTP